LLCLPWGDDHACGETGGIVLPAAGHVRLSVMLTLGYATDTILEVPLQAAFLGKRLNLRHRESLI